MHILTEPEVNENWRKTLKAGPFRLSPFFLEVWIWFVADAFGLALIVLRTFRHPDARSDLFLLLGIMVAFWLATAYLMSKLWRYTRSKLEEQNNPALLRASYLGFKVYQAYLGTWFFVCVVVAASAAIGRS